MRGLQHERLGTGVNFVGAGEEVICYKCSLPVHVGEKIFIIIMVYTFSEINQLWYVPNLLNVLDVPVKLNCFHMNDRLPLHDATALDNM